LWAQILHLPQDPRTTIHVFRTGIAENLMAHMDAALKSGSFSQIDPALTADAVHGVQAARDSDASSPSALGPVASTGKRSVGAWARFARVPRRTKKS
jgi:hypothetical protein